MSKIITIFSVFLAAVAVLLMIFISKSLSFFEREMIYAGKNNGFEIKIEKTSFLFPDKIVFKNAEVTSITNSGFSAKVSQATLDISLIDYTKSLLKLKLKKQKSNLSDFSDFAELTKILLYYNEKEILQESEAKINFDNENFKYNILSGKFNFGDFTISKIEISGILDSNITNFTAKLDAFCGQIYVIADYDFQKSDVNIQKISLQNIDLQQILPDDINASGAVFGEIIPQKLPASFSNLDEIFQKTVAECSLSVKNFKFEDKKISKPILDAVYFVGINDLNFKEITANFNYSYLNTRVKKFRADNFKYAISATGFFIPKSQNFDFDTEIHFNPDMKGVIQKNIWNSLLPSVPNNEGRKLTGKISGNPNNISVMLDTEIIKKGINSILNEIKDIFR